MSDYGAKRNEGHPRPTLGRIVHFRAPVAWKAAIVTEEGAPDAPMAIGVTVFDAHGQYFTGECLYDVSDPPTPGTWRWPPREPVPAFVNNGPPIDTRRFGGEQQ